MIKNYINIGLLAMARKICEASALRLFENIKAA